MLINEVSKNTKLTKKAIEYYIEQGLICPTILENGYRDFGENELKLLEQISVLRKLDINTDDIKAVLADKSNTALQVLSVRKELDFQREIAKKEILNKLSIGIPYAKISLELQAIDKTRTITEKLLDAFPGYFGRFICLHFSRFLDVPIKTKSQQSAYETIISFLDNVLAPNLPQDLQDYLLEEAKHIGTKQVVEIVENIKIAIESSDEFLSSNKEFLEQYLEYKQTDEYKNSQAYRVTEIMKQFFNTNGYYDVFIPAMKKLSPLYASYHVQLEIANKKMMAQYPEIKEIN